MRRLRSRGSEGRALRYNRVKTSALRGLRQCKGQYRNCAKGARRRLHDITLCRLGHSSPVFVRMISSLARDPGLDSVAGESGRDRRKLEVGGILSRRTVDNIEDEKYSDCDD
jgi:hypothetical protein